MRVLLVESNPDVASATSKMMRAEGFNVYSTPCGDEAIELGRHHDYDIIVMEMQLARGAGGLEVIHSLRLNKVKTPILVVSVVSELAKKLQAMKLGADAYLTKPFHKEEVVAYMHANVRRAKGHAQSLLKVGELVLNLDNHIVTYADAPVHLTQKEYRMLELFMLRQGRTVTKEQLMDHLYGGMDEPELKIIDVFVCKLRKKLDKASNEVVDIRTVWGQGWCLGGSSQQQAMSRSDMVSHLSAVNAA